MYVIKEIGVSKKETGIGIAGIPSRSNSSKKLNINEMQ